MAAELPMGQDAFRSCVGVAKIRSITPETDIALLVRQLG